MSGHTLCTDHWFKSYSNLKNTKKMLTSALKFIHSKNVHLRPEMAPKHQKTCKTKFYAIKRQHGPSAHANFEIFKENLRGEKKSPPHQNRVNAKIEFSTVKLL